MFLSKRRLELIERMVHDAEVYGGIIPLNCKREPVWGHKRFRLKGRAEILSFLELNPTCTQHAFVHQGTFPVDIDSPICRKWFDELIERLPSTLLFETSPGRYHVVFQRPDWLERKFVLWKDASGKEVAAIPFCHTRLPGPYNRCRCLDPGDPVPVPHSKFYDLLFTKVEAEQVGFHEQRVRSEIRQLPLEHTLICLDWFNPDDYDDWILVGMAFHTAGLFNIWRMWSKQSPKYSEEDLFKRWESFSLTKERLATTYTLRNEALERGMPPLPELDAGSGDDEDYEGDIDGKYTLTNKELGELVIPKKPWIVDGILYAGKPCIFGGPLKVFKTAFGQIMLICIAGGIDFLGFKVPKKRRVAFFSSEADLEGVQEQMLQTCSTLGLPYEELDIRWRMDLPNFNRKFSAERFARFLEEMQPEVAFLDSVYTGLTEGTRVNPGNYFEMGPLLKRLCNLCLRRGCTPVLVFHAGKSMDGKYRPMALHDLAWAGIGQYARQWVLLNHMVRYDESTTHHGFFLTAGGRGYSNIYTVALDEAKMAASEAVPYSRSTRQAEQKAEQKAAQKVQELAEARRNVLRRMFGAAAEQEDVVKSRLAKEVAGTDRAAAALVECGLIEEEKVKREGKKSATLLRLLNIEAAAAEASEGLPPEGRSAFAAVVEAVRKLETSKERNHTQTQTIKP
jgi:hypothetical protein